MTAILPDVPQVHHQVCPLCEASCGLLIHTEGDRVTAITGNKDDLHSRGHICPKGVSLQDIRTDPDRILEPMVREGHEWKAVTWDAALDLAAERLHAIRTEHGANALAIYTGNPTAHNFGAASHMKPLMAQLATRNIYSSASVDIFPNILVSSLMYGHQYLQPVPDLQRTDFLLVLGANPVVSNGSLMTAPAFPRQVRELRERGGRMVVIDPRKTETAKIADQHHFIVPATDAVLLLSMIHVLFRDNLVDTGHLTPLIDGLDIVRDTVAPFTPDMAAEITGISSTEIVGLTHDFAGARTAACYGRIGISVQQFGSLGHWAIQLLNMLTGNLDRVGGTLLAEPAVARFVRPELAAPPPRWHTRVRGLPEFAGSFSVAALADEILTPGEGKIRALIVFAGNPASALPNPHRVEQALASLDFQVAIDIYMNETSCHADLFLPTTAVLERGHYPGFSATFATRNFASYSRPMFPPSGNVKPEWEILDGLARRLAALSGAAPPDVRTSEQALAEELATGFHPEVTVQALLDNPNGIDLGPLRPSLPDRLLTPSRRIEAAPPRLVEDVKRLLAEPFDRNDLLLIGRRSPRSNNSWMHNIPRLMARRPDHHLIMNPQDLARLGLTEGEDASLRTAMGEVVIPVVVSDEVMPGTVCLPHGWGHKRDGVRLGIAAALPGANFNLLVDERVIDVPSAGSVVQGVRVTIGRPGAM
ncbi:MAG: dehydrogenase [Bradyrhizobium sp.]|nr:dehydrogenase [Bradyrhizobium sp.]